MRVIYNRPYQARELEAEIVIESRARFEVRLGDGERIAYASSQVKIVSALGSSERVFRLSDGAQCRVLRGQEHSFARFEEMYGRSGIQEWAHRIERSLLWIFIAALGVLLTGWLTIAYGLPALAEHLAHKASSGLRTMLSDYVVENMDMHWMDPTELSEEDQARLSDLFNTLEKAEGSAYPYRLLLRSSAIGPNAFALPDGRIVFTDELFELLETDAQIIAIFAHEMGHVEEQHGLRLVIQNAGVAVLASLVLGDVSSWSSLAGALPTMLAQNAYSREFEVEADAYAAMYLTDQGLGVEPMKEALLLLHEEAGDIPAEDILSTHPSLRVRVELLDTYESLEE